MCVLHLYNNSFLRSNSIQLLIRFAGFAQNHIELDLTTFLLSASYRLILPIITSTCHSRYIRHIELGALHLTPRYFTPNVLHMHELERNQNLNQIKKI